MADATSKARQWARENPLTADRVGVVEALACADRWKRARDKLLLEQERDEKRYAKLKAERDQYLAALKVVATAIHRDRSRNACWLAGEAVHVRAIEAALRIARKS